MDRNRYFANRLSCDGETSADVCKLDEDESKWRAGRGFVVRDLPWTEEKLRKMPPFEFENWAVIALGGIPNKVQVGDMGIDGRIYPVSAVPAKRSKEQLAFMDVWYPIQVKQRDKVGRPDIDSFEAVMMREDRQKGFFVTFRLQQRCDDGDSAILQAKRKDHRRIDGQGHS